MAGNFRHPPLRRRDRLPAVSRGHHGNGRPGHIPRGGVHFLKRLQGTLLRAPARGQQNCVGNPAIEEDSLYAYGSDVDSNGKMTDGYYPLI